MKTNIKTDTPEWLEARNSSVGGSEVANLFSDIIGMPKYYSYAKLWQIKKGLIPPVERNIHMAIGLALEPVIAEFYEQQTGRTLTKEDAFRIHPSDARMLASLDYSYTDGDGSKVIVECKNVGIHAAKNTWKRANGEYEPPLSYILQVQHQLECCKDEGYDRAEICFLIAGETEVRTHLVNRDEELGAAILNKIQDFWRSVTNDDEPELLPDRDRDFIHKRLSSVSSVDTVIDDCELENLAQKYTNIKTKINELKDLEKQTGAAIELKIIEHDANEIMAGDYRITAKERAGFTRKAQPEKYVEPTNILRVKQITN